MKNVQQILTLIVRKKMITFRKVNEAYGWLGNMSPYSVLHEGKTYRTTEALFQALRFDDESIIELIRSQKSPMAAKMVAKPHKSKMIIEKFSNQDIENMRLCLRLKLAQHPELKTLLLATNDEQIIEDTTNRHRVCPWGAKLKNGKWIGENLLGKLWMQLRTELRSEAKLE